LFAKLSHFSCEDMIITFHMHAAGGVMTLSKNGGAEERRRNIHCLSIRNAVTETQARREDGVPVEEIPNNEMRKHKKEKNLGVTSRSQDFSKCKRHHDNTTIWLCHLGVHPELARCEVQGDRPF
jgi:hypothetical protein